MVMERRSKQKSITALTPCKDWQVLAEFKQWLVLSLKEDQSLQGNGGEAGTDDGTHYSMGRKTDSQLEKPWLPQVGRGVKRRRREGQFLVCEERNDRWQMTAAV